MPRQHLHNATAALDAARNDLTTLTAPQAFDSLHDLRAVLESAARLTHAIRDAIAHGRADWAPDHPAADLDDMAATIHNALTAAATSLQDIAHGPAARAQEALSSIGSHAGDDRH